MKLFKEIMDIKYSVLLIDLDMGFNCLDWPTPITKSDMLHSVFQADISSQSHDFVAKKKKKNNFSQHLEIFFKYGTFSVLLISVEKCCP